MSRSRFTPRQMATAGIIAAIYAALTLLLPIPQYGGIQFRVAEAMTVLPFLFPEAVPVSLSAASWPICWVLPCPWTGSLAQPPRCWPLSGHPGSATGPGASAPGDLQHGPGGAELALFYPAEGMGFWAAFGLNALTVGIGEAAACFILGSLLLQVLPRVPALRAGWLLPGLIPALPEKEVPRPTDAGLTFTWR